MGASPRPAVLVVESMLEFILAVLFVELTPGPNMAYLATLALARGRTAGLFAIIGIALGLSVHAAVASFGFGQLLLLYPWLYEILRWIGVIYLLFLAWEGWQTKEKSADTVDLNSTFGPLMLRGFFSNVFNPKSVLFFVSFVVMQSQSDQPSLAVSSTCSVVASASASVSLRHNSGRGTGTGTGTGVGTNCRCILPPDFDDRRGLYQAREVP